jgi:hypothetical protein
MCREDEPPAEEGKTMGFRYAVEIETHMPAGMERGPHGHGVPVPWLPGYGTRNPRREWLADADPSIVPPTYERWGVEYVSPILDGPEGLAEIHNVVNAIKARDGRVNVSCGLHVHVDFDKRDKAAVRRLTRLVANVEKGLYAMTGTLARERGIGARYATNWCKSIKQYGTAARAIRHATRDRYHLLNLATTKPTVEFRVFGASLNPVKIAAWVRICVGLVERALAPNSPAAPWNHKARNGGLNGTTGIGEKEAARLMFALGWTYEGFGTRKWGRRAFGAIGETNLEVSINEILRLARKYDAALAAEQNGGGQQPPQPN